MVDVSVTMILFLPLLVHQRNLNKGRWRDAWALSTFSHSHHYFLRLLIRILASRLLRLIILFSRSPPILLCTTLYLHSGWPGLLIRWFWSFHWHPLILLLFLLLIKEFIMDPIIHITAWLLMRCRQIILRLFNIVMLVKNGIDSIDDLLILVIPRIVEWLVLVLVYHVIGLWHWSSPDGWAHKTIRFYA